MSDKKKTKKDQCIKCKGEGCKFCKFKGYTKNEGANKETL